MEALKQAGTRQVSTEVLKVTLETGVDGDRWCSPAALWGFSLSHRFGERCCSHRGVVCGGGWSLNADLLTSGPEQGRE